MKMISKSRDQVIELTELPVSQRLKRLIRIAGRTLGQALGVPDFEAYRVHRRERHPDEPLMSREEFYRNRHQARYARGRGRCC
jgi:uncharacterized short protein YbdD (DUF466 family)